MKPAKLSLLTFLTASSLALSSPASSAAPSASPRPGEGTTPASPENQSTDDDARKYEEAYNKGDAKALAGLYSDDVYYIDQDGAEVKGRDAMEKLLADNFKQNPGAKLAVTTEEVKQLAPDVKVGRGLATVTMPDGTAVATRYTAVRVKKGDHWRFRN